jgi:ESCRT-II complex subunit VPS22
MRRGAGISALSRQTASSASYAALSSTISAQQLTDLKSQLEAFKTALVAFSKAHKDDIRKDPALRHKFQQMCAAIGVDPLAGSGPASGGGAFGGAGFWQDILGLSDWQYELAVQAVDICVSTRERNGGIIEMDDLLRRLARLRGVDRQGSSGGISAEDVIRSIKTLSPLGSGYEVLKISGQTFIRSVPRELDVDQGALLAFASEHGGAFNERLIMRMLGWNDVRARNAIDNMVKRDGIGWIDEQAEGGVDVWVPSTLNWQET